MKIWAWKDCNLECQFPSDIISSMRYLQERLHFWDPCIRTTCNSHRGSTIFLAELLQIIYTLFCRYSCIFWFNIARLKFDVKELGKLDVLLQGWWGGLIYPPYGTLSEMLPGQHDRFVTLSLRDSGNLGPAIVISEIK